MRRPWLAVVAAGLMVAASAGAVAASQCPGLIKQAREALAQYKRSPMPAPVKDATVAAVETNLRGAQGAHDAGEHAESTRQAREALKLLGK
ncbi:MAG: hypothetical protein HYU41_00820 [Candidatus Rokubacteria bacterium]|nr:hypothetical protein [Candidatus Rokubacteria bacterium]